MSAIKKSPWWKKLVPQRPRTKPQARRYTPQLVTLEERIVPDATLSIVGGIVTYSDTQNLANALIIKQDGTNYVFSNDVQVIDTDDASLSDGDKTATFPIAGITQINVTFGSTAAKSITLGDFNAAVAGLSVAGNNQTGSNASIASTGSGLASSGAVAITGFKLLDIQKLITGATGNVNLSADTMTVAAAVTATAGNVTLSADTLAITAAVGAAGNRVTLQPKSNARPINLGTEVGTSLSLESAEINLVTAGVLQVGSTTAGAITVSAAIAPSGTSILDLRSDGGISGAGPLSESTLRFTADGVVNLTGTFGTVSGTNSTGVTLNNSDTLVVGETGNGIVAGGAVNIIAVGTLQVSEDITTTGANAITLTTTDDATDTDHILVGAGVTIQSGTGNINLNADNNISLSTSATITTGNPGKINLTIDAAGTDANGAILDTGATLQPGTGATLNAANGANFVGGDLDDIFIVAFSNNTPISVDGGLGTNELQLCAVGLNVKHNAATDTLTSAPRKPISYTDLNSISIFSQPPVDLIGTNAADVLVINEANHTARLNGGVIINLGANAFTFDGLNGSDRVIYQGTASGDDVIYRARPGFPGESQFNFNGGAFNTLQNAEVFQFDALAGDDLLTIDYVHGDPLGAQGLDFNGGGNAGDTLAVNAATAGVKSHTGRYLPDPLVTGNGQVRVDDNVAKSIRFAGLAPVNVTGFTTYTVNFPNANDIINVAAGTGFGLPAQPALRVTGTSDGVAFESLAVWDVTTLVIDTQTNDGVDTVTVQATNLGSLHQVTNLQLLTGGLADSVSVTGAVDLTGDLLIDHSLAGVTTLNATVTTGDAQEYRGPVVIGVANPVLTASGTAVFEENIAGPGALTVNAAGTTTFNGTVGTAVIPLGSFATGNGGTTVLNGGAVHTVGTQMYSDGVDLGAATNFNSSGVGPAGNITLNSTLDGAVAVNVNTAGTTTFAGQVGNNNALSSLTTNALGSTSITGSLVRTTGTQSYNDPVLTGSGTVSLTSLNQDLLFNQTLDTQGVLAASANGLITLTGAVQLGEDASFSSTGGGAILFSSTLDRRAGAPAGSPDVTVTTSGTTTFQQAVGTTSLASLTTNGGGTTVVNTTTVTTSGLQNFAENVQLGAGTTFTSTASGAITFGGTLNGDFVVNVNTSGTTTFSGQVGNAAALRSLSTNPGGSTNINGGLVRTNNGQSYGDAVQTAAVATTLQTLAAGQNISFANSLDTLGGLSVQATQHISASGAVRLSGDASFVSSGGGNVTFSSTLDRRVSAPPGSPAVTVTTAGTIDFDGAVGGNPAVDGTSKALISLLVNGGGGAVNLDGGFVTTLGAQTYSKVAAIGTGTVAELTSSGGMVWFQDRVNGSGGLEVDTSGQTRFDHQIGGDPAVDGTTLALASLTTTGGGVTLLNGGFATTTGVQTFADDVSLGAHSLFTSSGGGASGNVSFNATLSGIFDVTVNTAGTTTFGGPVGLPAPLLSLTTNAGGATHINGGLVSTFGSQLYGDAVQTGVAATTLQNSFANQDITFASTLDTLGALTVQATRAIAASGGVELTGDALFQSTGDGAILFASTVDRLGGTPDVTVTTGGTTTFQGAVGANPLASLTTNGGGTTFVNGGLVATTGTQLYSDAVQVGATSNFNSSGAINYVATLDGAFAVTVNADGVTTFGGMVGNTNPLAALTTNPAGSTNINGGLVSSTGSQSYGDVVHVGNVNTLLFANGTSPNISFGQAMDTLQPLTVQAFATSAGFANITFNGAVRLMGDASFTSTAPGTGGNVVFNNTLDRQIGGSPAVSVNTTGETRFNGAVGGLDPLLSLVTDFGGTTFVQGGLVRTVNAQQYFDAARLGVMDASFITNNADVLFNNTLNGSVDRFDASMTLGSGNLSFVGTASSLGNVSVTSAHHVGINAGMTAATFVQSAGSGTTSFQGVNTFDVGNNFRLNVTTGSVVLNGTVTTLAGHTRLNPASGVTQPGGSLTTQILRLEGGGAFTLGRPDNDFELFSASVVGPITLHDTNDLEIKKDLANPIAAAGVTTNHHNLTITTDQNFTAENSNAVLIDLGAGQFVMVPGLGGPSTTRFVTQIKAALATFGSPILSTNNVNDDAFVMRPSEDTALRVFGNNPTILNQVLNPAGDGLSLHLDDLPDAQVIAINITSPETAASMNGEYKFPGSTFEPIQFVDIEKLENDLDVSATMAHQKSTKTETVTLIGEIDGAFPLEGFDTNSAVINNPFVVSPKFVNSQAPFSSSRVTMGDIDGDGLQEAIIVAGSNRAPLVTVLDGREIQAAAFFKRQVKKSTQIYAFEPTFMGGLYVALGDVTGADGKKEIIVGADSGRKAEIRVFNYVENTATPELDFVLTRDTSFTDKTFALSEFSTRGVRVAAGDFNNDGKDEIVAATGPGVQNRVKVFSSTPQGNPPTAPVFASFSPYKSTFKGGVTVDMSDWNGDGFEDLLTGPGVGHTAQVFVFSGAAIQTAATANPKKSINPSSSLLETWKILDQVFEFTANKSLKMGLASKKKLLNQGVTNVAFAKFEGKDTIVAGSPRGMRTEVSRYEAIANSKNGNKINSFSNTPQQALFASSLFKFLDGIWIATQNQ